MKVLDFSGRITRTPLLRQGQSSSSYLKKLRRRWHYGLRTSMAVEAHVWYFSFSREGLFRRIFVPGRAVESVEAQGVALESVFLCMLFLQIVRHVGG